MDIPQGRSSPDRRSRRTAQPSHSVSTGSVSRQLSTHRSHHRVVGNVQKVGSGDIAESPTDGDLKSVHWRPLSQSTPVSLLSRGKTHLDSRAAWPAGRQSSRENASRKRFTGGKQAMGDLLKQKARSKRTERARRATLPEGQNEKGRKRARERTREGTTGEGDEQCRVRRSLLASSPGRAPGPSVAIETITHPLAEALLDLQLLVGHTLPLKYPRRRCRRCY